MPTAIQSRIPASPSMTKANVEIDNCFTPSPLPELPWMAEMLDEFDSEFSPCRRAGTPADEWAMVATTVAVALFIASLALARSMGALG